MIKPNCKLSDVNRSVTVPSIIYREDVARHNCANNAWIIYNYGVYNITKFIDIHPGGKSILMEHLGKDVSSLIYSNIIHKHSITAIEMLNEYYIGQLVENYTKDFSIKRYSLDGYNESELIDWSRALTFQVSKLGKDYNKWVHSPVDKQLILFDNPILEYFTRTKWYTVPILWFPMIIYMSWLSITQKSPSIFLSSFSCKPIGFFDFIIMFVLGYFAWSFVEYILHRFIFHYVPTHPLLISFHFMIHGQHHKVPFDKERLVFPPLPAAIIMIPLFILLLTILPLSSARAVYAGGLLGYVLYDVTHYFIHHAPINPGSYFGKLKSYHTAHHFSDPTLGFGVSTKFWDYPFRTLINTKN